MNLNVYTKALNLVQHSYERATTQGDLELSSISSIFSGLSQDQNDDVDPVTIINALDNLPGEVWRMRDIFMQADSLPVGLDERWQQANSGLRGMELTDGTLLVDLGDNKLGFAVFYWLGMLQVQAQRMFDRAEQVGLSARLEAFFNRNMQASQAPDYQPEAAAGDTTAGDTAAGEGPAGEDQPDIADQGEDLLEADGQAGEETLISETLLDDPEELEEPEEDHQGQEAMELEHDQVDYAGDHEQPLDQPLEQAPLDEQLVELLMTEIAFVAGLNMDELVRIDAQHEGRLIPCLSNFAWQGWRPRVVFHQKLSVLRRRPERFARQVGAALAELSPGDEPIHIILTDNPAVSDLLSPYARELRDVLVQWATENFELLKAGEVILKAVANERVTENLLYWIIRDFLAQGDEVWQEYAHADGTCGIVHRGAGPGSPGSYQLIDLARLDTDLVDPRLNLTTAQRSALGGVVVVLPLQDMAGAREALGLILNKLGSRVHSINVIRRTLPLKGKSALFIPTAWVDQRTGVCQFAPPTVDISAEDFYGLLRGEVEDKGTVVSVGSSLGLAADVLDFYQEQWDTLGVDLGGSELLNTVYSEALPYGGIPLQWKWRSVYYACDNLLETDGIRQGLAESKVLAPSYAATIAILRTILMGRAEPPPEPEPEPQSRKQRSAGRSGPQVRLRV